MLNEYSFKLKLIPKTHKLEIFIIIKDASYLDGNYC